jgi:ribonucleotide monophosphatase NagD (HAD superfamily)
MDERDGDGITECCVPRQEKTMTEKKAIIIDLDGTLFNAKKEITEFNVRKVNECFDKGHIIIIATARPFRTVERRLPIDLGVAILHERYST